MSDKYKDPKEIYFGTFTVVEWIDLFTRRELRLMIVDSTSENNPK